MEALLTILFVVVILPLTLGAIAVLEEPDNNWP